MSVYPNVTKEDRIKAAKLSEQQKNQRFRKSQNQSLKRGHQ